MEESFSFNYVGQKKAPAAIEPVVGSPVAAGYQL